MNKRIEFQKFISNNILDNMITLNHAEYSEFYALIKTELETGLKTADKVWENELCQQKSLKRVFGKAKLSISRKEMF